MPESVTGRLLPHPHTINPALLVSLLMLVAASVEFAAALIAAAKQLKYGFLDADTVARALVRASIPLGVLLSFGRFLTSWGVREWRL
jgi:hypothetical protein